MVDLGQKVKDRVSGLTGIATARTTYIQGCNRVSVQPPVNKNGTLPEYKAFDEPDLIVVGKGVKVENVSGGERFVIEKM